MATHRADRQKVACGCSFGHSMFIWYPSFISQKHFERSCITHSHMFSVSSHSGRTHRLLMIRYPASQSVHLKASWICKENTKKSSYECMGRTQGRQQKGKDAGRFRVTLRSLKGGFTRATDSGVNERPRTESRRAGII